MLNVRHLYGGCLFFRRVIYKRTDIIMKYTEKQDLLKKMVQERLTDEEEFKLLSYRPVTERMLHQLDYAEDTTITDKTNYKKIWNNIYDRIDNTRNIYAQIKLYKKYSLVASFLLLLSIPGTIYFTSIGNEESVNTIISGIRNIERVTLPDGTIVQLGSGSRLIYPQSFKGKTREIELTGQAFFNVAKDAKKPFIVNTKDMKVKALGTSFEVYSYDEGQTVETILLDGSVQVAVANSFTHKVNYKIMVPNQRLTFDRSAGTINVEKVDADKYTLWRNHQTPCFENEKLAVIIPRLEQWFDCKIICNEDISEKYRYTLKVRDESIEQILFVLCESSSIKYIKTDDKSYTLISK